MTRPPAAAACAAAMVEAVQRAIDALRGPAKEALGLCSVVEANVADLRDPLKRRYEFHYPPTIEALITNRTIQAAMIAALKSQSEHLSAAGYKFSFLFVPAGIEAISKAVAQSINQPPESA
jgi:hypothetical protein